MRVTSNTFSNAVILPRNNSCNSFSTKYAVNNIAAPALYKMIRRSHKKEIVLVYHSQSELPPVSYKIYVKEIMERSSSTNMLCSFVFS
jgi:hypothetical protein